MKTSLIFIIGMVILATSNEGLITYISCGLVSWAYYRMGKGDGFRAGKEYLLKGNK